MVLASNAIAAHPPRLQDADDALREALASHQHDPDFWSSKDRDRSDSAHCIFQYPAMMVPVVQRRLLQAVLQAQDCANSLYDPFAGSGTSLVSGMHYGLDVYGNDINPLAVLISRTRTARCIDVEVGQAAREVVKKAQHDRRWQIETELTNRTKWFRDEVARDLSRLRRAIRTCDNLWTRRFMWVTLAETVRLTSNDRTSTYKLHARPEGEIAGRLISPLDIFANLAAQNAKSFIAFHNTLRQCKVLKRGRYSGRTAVRIGDTRSLPAQEGWPPPDRFDLLMTSPPYGDNLTTVTYGQHSYLPLHWIDLEDIDHEANCSLLRTTQEIDRRSLGGRSRPLGSEVEEKLFHEAPSLKMFTAVLPDKPKDAKVRLLRFYADFRESLIVIQNCVAENGYMIWTVGNRSLASRQVPTDRILEELLSARGCTRVAALTRRIHHKRMAVRNASSSTMREESILLMRNRIG